LEIFYIRASLGSVKISPEEREVYIAELKKRCPGMIVYSKEQYADGLMVRID
jgi:hypothetical protein